MQIKSRGIVLHTTNYSESSLVVKIYTETSGLCSFIVSGVRTKNSRFKSSLFQPLSLVEVVASGKPGQTMYRITEIHLSPPFSGIPENVIKSSIAIFIAEVIYRSIKEEEPNPSLFHFMDSGIQIFDLSRENCSRFHLFFMTQLTRHLGSYPHGTCIRGVSVLDLREGLFRDSIPLHTDYLLPDVTALFYDLMQTDFENFHTIPIPSPLSKQLLAALVAYFEMHQTHGATIRSHRILETVMG